MIVRPHGYGLLIGALSALLSHFASAEEAWKPLLIGTDLKNWETFMVRPDPAWEVPGMKRDAEGHYLEQVGIDRDPLKVFNLETLDGHPVLHVTGQGFGVITTRESFKNFHLRLHMKWGERKWSVKINEPRDSGLLYWVHGQPGIIDGIWPKSVEMQIQEHDTGDLFALGTRITVNAEKRDKLWIYAPDGSPAPFAQLPPVQNRCVKLEDVEKPNGEWNVLELICLNGDSIHIVNGKVVMRLHNAERLDGDTHAPLREGRISLQTEGAEVFYRDVEIRPIEAVPGEFAEKDERLK